MRHILIFCALLVFAAAPAWSADTNHYPQTIIDQTCTDSFDTPTAVQYYGSNPQISGSADNLCDNDPRIVTGAITVATQFGPFKLDPGNEGVYVFADADTVAGGTPTWRLNYVVLKPFKAEFDVLDQQAAQVSGTGDKLYVYGNSNLRVVPEADDQMAAGLARQYYLELFFHSATSWTGELSQMQFRR